MQRRFAGGTERSRLRRLRGRVGAVAYSSRQKYAEEIPSRLGGGGWQGIVELLTGQQGVRFADSFTHAHETARACTVSRTREAIDFTAALGVHQVNIGTLRGQLPSGAERADARTAARASFDELLDHARTRKVGIALEAAAWLRNQLAQCSWRNPGLEKQDGWKLLFDGKTTAGWRGYKMDKMPPGWKVLDGALVRVSGGAGGKGAGGGDDIVTTEAFENFELQLEWKVLKNGNSGVLYHGSEESVTSWHYAPEVQILDNSAHPTRDPRQLAGACYDLYAPSKDATKPPGQWNHLRILVNGAHVAHWMNGEKIVAYELWSDDWNQRVANSKHKSHAKFGTFKKGPLCLQDHTDRIEFRNLKIRPLPPTDGK